MAEAAFPVGRVSSVAIPVRPIPRVRGGAYDAWRSVLAGLVTIGLVGVTMATFGPVFSLAVAYGLLAAAFTAAVLSLRWADRVAHAATPRGTARRDARSGQVLSGIALLMILYLTNAWIPILYFLPLTLLLGLLGWSIHRARVARSSAPPEVRT